MLAIDVENLKENSEELNYLVDKYEENVMSIVQELTNAELSWHDNNSSLFFLDISQQKNKLQEYISNLQKNISYYDKIVEELRKIDSSIKKIFINQKYKESILSSYKSVISTLTTMKNKYNNLYYSFCTYYESNLIRNESKKINTYINDLTQSKNRVESIFNKLNTLEKEIIIVKNKITMNKIDTFEFEKYII